MEQGIQLRESVLFRYNINADGIPISVKIDNENKQISPLHNTIQLEQIPDETQEIILLKNGTARMIQVYNEDEISDTTFYVDYSKGLIKFTKANAGKTTVINYYGKGVELIGASRIYDETSVNGETVIKTLQEIINVGKQYVEILGNVIDVKNKLEQMMNESKQLKSDLGVLNQEAKNTNTMLSNTNQAGTQINLTLNQTMAQASNDIAKINATGNKSLVIGGSQFAGNQYTWNHAMNNDNLVVNFIDSDTNEPLMPDYKILDKNNILIRNSVEHPNIKVVLSASYYQGNALFGTNVEEFAGDSIGIGAKKVRLKDGNGVVENPVTDSDAVYMADGTTKLTKKISDIDGFLEQNRKKLSYKELQTNLLANFYKKTREGINVRLSLQGDSMFYGYDTFSEDKREPSTQLTDDGVAHNKTRASKTLDEAMQEYCNLLFGENKIKITNRSYAGDTVVTGVKHWSKNPNVDLVFLGYGINDSRGSYDYSGDINTFLNGYREIIEQQLDWGTAVILVTPLKARFHYSSTTITDVFAGAIYQLAKEYGILVIDGDMLLQGYNYTFWSDSTHLNGKGYTVVAYRLVSVLIGNGLLQLNKIYGKSFLSTNAVIQNLVYDDTATIISQDNLPTPSQGLENCGFGIAIPPNKSVTYSIFTDRENYCVIPSIYLNSSYGTIQVSVNNGVQQADWNTDYIKNIMITDDENISGIQDIDVNLRSSADNTLWEDDYKLNGIEPITITSCGFNTITIKNNTNDNILLHGLLIEPLEDFYDNKGFCLLSTHKNYTDTNEVAETRIKLDFLLNMLGLSNRLAQYYWNPLINITINNADCSVYDTYQIRIGTVVGIHNYGLIGSTQLISTSPKRILNSIEYDSETKEYVLKWGGDLTVASMINIKVADSGAMVKYFQPTNAIPTAEIGGIYMDRVTNAFKKCVDGESWTNM